MNTRGAALSEGVANRAFLMAYAVTEVSQLPDDDLKLGTLLALLQDDAKNQSSWLTWREQRPQAEVVHSLRQEYLCSTKRTEARNGSCSMDGGSPRPRAIRCTRARAL